MLFKDIMCGYEGINFVRQYNKNVATFISFHRYCIV